MEITDFTDRPSNLFNLQVLDGARLEAAIRRDPSLQVVLDAPETVFWHPLTTLDRTWRRA
jgi:hypothetical protein